MKKEKPTFLPDIPGLSKESVKGLSEAYLLVPKPFAAALVALLVAVGLSWAGAWYLAKLTADYVVKGTAANTASNHINDLERSSEQKEAEISRRLDEVTSRSDANFVADVKQLLSVGTDRVIATNDLSDGILVAWPPALGNTEHQDIHVQNMQTKADAIYRVPAATSIFFLPRDAKLIPGVSYQISIESVSPKNEQNWVRPDPKYHALSQITTTQPAH